MSFGGGRGVGWLLWGGARPARRVLLALLLAGVACAFMALAGARAQAQIRGSSQVIGDTGRNLGERHEARVAAVVKVDVTKGANAVLGELLKRIEKAAGLAGPKGVALGLALAGVKGLLSLNFTKKDQEEEDSVKETLKEIGTRIANLHTEVENSGFKTQLEFTKRDIGEIQNAEEAFDKALKQNVSTKDGKSAFEQWLRTFIERARKLDSIPTHLNNALTATPFEGNPSLLAGVRRKIGSERFFTSKSSERIRQFFRYYEWEETRLATLLSEYYNLDNRPAVAISTVKAIKDEYLPKQRSELPSHDLNDDVFIDTKRKLMWRVTPELRSASQFVQSYAQPALRQCNSANDLHPCDFNLTTKYGGHSDWRMPTPSEAKGLVSDRVDIDPLGFLKTAGVNFKDTENGVILRTNEFTLITSRLIRATVLVLKRGGASKNTEPGTTLARYSGEGYILWVRSTTDQERAQYW